MFDTCLSLPPDCRVKPISIVCTDTRVEIPAIVEMVEGTLEKIKLLPRAEKELEALSPAIQDQIVGKLELLRDFPEIEPAMFDAFQGYRALLAARNTYRIIYRIVSDDLIEVAYIRHCARQTRLRLIRGKE